MIGELLAGNLATASSLLMRASVVEPIPAEIPYTDWWFAARAALVGRDRLRRRAAHALPLPRRQHHARRRRARRAARELRKALTFVRWFLRRMPPGAASPRGLATAWTYFEHCERELAALGEPATCEATASGAARGEAARAA